MLIEIFRQKLIASNVFLVFLDHLKPKIFFVSQPWWPIYSSLYFSKSLDPPLINDICSHYLCNLFQHHKKLLKYKQKESEC